MCYVERRQCFNDLPSHGGCRKFVKTLNIEKVMKIMYYNSIIPSKMNVKYIILSSYKGHM